jgi:hypothetical protein
MYLLQAAVLLGFAPELLLLSKTSCQPFLFIQPKVSSAVLLVLVLLLMLLLGTWAPKTPPTRCSAAQVVTWQEGPQQPLESNKEHVGRPTMLAASRDVSSRPASSTCWCRCCCMTLVATLPQVLLRKAPS